MPEEACRRARSPSCAPRMLWHMKNVDLLVQMIEQIFDTYRFELHSPKSICCV